MFVPKIYMSQHTKKYKYTQKNDLNDFLSLWNL